MAAIWVGEKEGGEGGKGIGRVARREERERGGNRKGVSGNNGALFL